MSHTYLGLLDKSALFELLLRMHYPELINITKCRNYLYKITCTPYFMERWKQYNIQTVTCPSKCGCLPSFFFSDGYIRVNYSIEVDRQNLKHGLARCYNREGMLQEELTYVQDVLHGTHTSWRHGQLSLVETYVNDKLHGLRTVTYPAQSVGYIPFVNGKIEGVHITKDKDDQWTELIDYKDGNGYTKHYGWYPNSSLKYIKAWHYGTEVGKQFEFYDNGIKSREYTMSYNGQINWLCPIKEWDRNGVPIVNI